MEGDLDVLRNSTAVKNIICRAVRRKTAFIARSCRVTATAARPVVRKTVPGEGIAHENEETFHFHLKHFPI